MLEDVRDITIAQTTKLGVIALVSYEYKVFQRHSVHFSILTIALRHLRNCGGWWRIETTLSHFLFGWFFHITFMSSKYWNLFYLAAHIFPEYLLISLVPVTLVEKITNYFSVSQKVCVLLYLQNIIDPLPFSWRHIHMGSRIWCTSPCYSWSFSWSRYHLYRLESYGRRSLYVRCW